MMKPAFHGVWWWRPFNLDVQFRDLIPFLSRRFVPFQISYYRKFSLLLNQLQEAFIPFRSKPELGFEGIDYPRWWAKTPLRPGEHPAICPPRA